MRLSHALIGAQCLLVGGLIGIALERGGRAGADDFGTRRVAPRGLSDDEMRRGFVSQPVPSMDIRLRLEPLEDIRRAMPGAYAYSTWNPAGTLVCEIHMPNDTTIYTTGGSFPGARWGSTNYGDVLAHEVLHCLRGEWHGIGGWTLRRAAPE